MYPNTYTGVLGRQQHFLILYLSIHETERRWHCLVHQGCFGIAPWLLYRQKSTGLDDDYDDNQYHFLSSGFAFAGMRGKRPRRLWELIRRQAMFWSNRSYDICLLLLFLLFPLFLLKLLMWRQAMFSRFNFIYFEKNIHHEICFLKLIWCLNFGCLIKFSHQRILTII